MVWRRGVWEWEVSVGEEGRWGRVRQCVMGDIVWEVCRVMYIVLMSD